jgi:hypothetical protein
MNEIATQFLTGKDKVGVMVFDQSQAPYPGLSPSRGKEVQLRCKIASMFVF